jgi:hypothetical protein
MLIAPDGPFFFEALRIFLSANREYQTFSGTTYGGR